MADSVGTGVSYCEVQRLWTNWLGFMSYSCDLFKKKKREGRPCDEDSNSQFHGMHQVLLPAKEDKRWAKMVGTGESKIWPLDDEEEQLKTYHLITNSKLHHYRMTNGHSKCVALTLSRSDMKFSLAALCYGYPKPVWFCPVVGSCCEKFILL